LALLIPLQADEIPVGLPRAEAATGWLLRRGAEETR
jgi:hypothetical protein